MSRLFTKQQQELERLRTLTEQETAPYTAEQIGTALKDNHESLNSKLPKLPFQCWLSLDVTTVGLDIKSDMYLNEEEARKLTQALADFYQISCKKGVINE